MQFNKKLLFFLLLLLSLTFVNAGTQWCNEADINQDAIVDASDLSIVRTNFGCSGACEGDTNGDEMVDANDLAIVRAEFGSDECDKVIVEMNSCGVLDQANAIYLLKNNITTTDTCFTITADNIILDGQGFNVDGDDDLMIYGVHALGRLNITIRNLNITDFDTAIKFVGTNNSLIENNIMISNTGEGGINFISSFNNHIINNLADSNYFGIRLFLSSNNSLIGNKANFNADGLRISSSPNNNVIGGTIDNSYLDAIFLIGNSSNNNFTNVIIRRTKSNYKDIRWDMESINGTYLINMPNVGKYLFAGPGGTIVVKNSQFGEVEFLQAVNGSGTNLTDDIKILRDMAFINTKPGLNKQARISLYGDVAEGLINPVILNNGLECNAITVPSCNAITALTEENVIFDVSGAGNYSVGERPVGLNGGVGRFSYYKNITKRTFRDKD